MRVLVAIHITPPFHLRQLDGTDSIPLNVEEVVAGVLDVLNRMAAYTSETVKQIPAQGRGLCGRILQRIDFDSTFTAFILETCIIQ
jgi:hypothetical protein